MGQKSNSNDNMKLANHLKIQQKGASTWTRAITLPSGNFGAGVLLNGFSSALTAKRSLWTAVTLSSHKHKRQTSNNVPA